MFQSGSCQHTKNGDSDYDYSRGNDINRDRLLDVKGFPDEPIQLVKPDESHKKLVLVEGNLEYLKRIPAPVAIVAVVGKFHSGKSFLMNQLMAKRIGFGIGPSVQPTTMGIWMWGRVSHTLERCNDTMNTNVDDKIEQPASMKINGSEEASVIFLDTEGFAANNVSENYDAKVFAVATMLSSHLLYNSVKIVDQSDIDYLELLARRTQLFALRSQMSRSKWLNDFNQDLLSFPPLTWIVQDFFQDIESGLSPQEWLHKLMTTHTRENESYEISILDIFKSVDCHTLFIPATKRSLLNNLSKASEADLTAEYKEERDALIQKLRKQITPKKKQNRYISGTELGHLMRILVSAANEGSLADVPSRWDAFVERLQLTAVEDCHKFYEEEISSFITTYGPDTPVRPAKLSEMHTQMSSKSLELLKHLLQGLDDALESGIEKLKNKLSLSYDRTKDLNDKKIRLEQNEIQNSAEIKMEEELNKLLYPMPSLDLQKEIKIVSTMIEDNLYSRCSYFLENDETVAFVSSVLKSLQKVVDSIIFRNSEGIREYFSTCITDAIEKYRLVVHSNWEMSRPQAPNILQRMKDSAKSDSEQLFIQKTKKYELESFYGPSFSHLREKLREEDAAVDLENSELAKRYVKKHAETGLEQLRDRTGPGILSLPVFDTDLEKVLDAEIQRALERFEESMSDFIVYSCYSPILDEFKSEIRKLVDTRRQENIEAFTREVHKPLDAAKKIILLSASKYSTVFSLKQFVSMTLVHLVHQLKYLFSPQIRQVCLIHLDDGKPRNWPQELKLQIINNFMNASPELSDLIKSRDGIWSSVMGFIEWILWMIGMISE